jgi:hypothetical protein
LADIIGIYLASPIAKTYFGKQAIEIVGMPSVRDGGTIFAPTNVEYPIYHSTLDLNMCGYWRMQRDFPDTLLKFFVDIEAEVVL